MPDDHELVLMPRYSANDDAGMLVGWSKENGDTVSAGDKICEVEFSKSVVEIMAPRAGFLFRMREEGEEVVVGEPLAAIAATQQKPSLGPATSTGESGLKISAKAQKLIETHGLDVAQFRGLGIVREEHVLAALQQQPASSSAQEGELKPLSPVQRRVAKTLSESVRTIPHSYLCRWIEAERLDDRVLRIAQVENLMLSVSDWLIATVARQAVKHPQVLTSWRENGIFHHPYAHVGFALNQANGELVVPVIHHAESIELEALVGQIRGYQKKALRHKLEPADLSGGTITVTSLIGTGAQQVFPILVPGQSVIIAIGDRIDLGAVPTYCLTIAFDHRVLNGAQAAAFLDAVAAALIGDSTHDE